MDLILAFCSTRRSLLWCWATSRLTASGCLGRSLNAPCLLQDTGGRTRGRVRMPELYRWAEPRSAGWISSTCLEQLVAICVWASLSHHHSNQLLQCLVFISLDEWVEVGALPIFDSLFNCFAFQSLCWLSWWSQLWTSSWFNGLICNISAVESCYSWKATIWQKHCSRTGTSTVMCQPRRFFLKISTPMQCWQ